MTDPMEEMVEMALTDAAIPFERETHTGALDFHLTNYSVRIEVKQFHAPRVVDQMARHEHVIVLQGRNAVITFCAMVRCWT